MIAAPWYLLSFGVLMIIAGLFMAQMQRPDTPGAINPRMSDAEIAERLRKQQKTPLPNLVIAAGGVCIVISLLWRIARVVF